MAKSREKVSKFFFFFFSFVARPAEAERCALHKGNRFFFVFISQIYGRLEHTKWWEEMKEEKHVIRGAILDYDRWLS